MSVVTVAAVLISVLVVVMLMRKRRRESKILTVKMFTKSLHTQESEQNFRHVAIYNT